MPVPSRGTVLGTLLLFRTFWQAQSTPSADYRVFIHALDLKGNVIAQITQPLLDGKRPTSQWQTDKPVLVEYNFVIPPNKEF